jgi:hypothetical protein
MASFTLEPIRSGSIHCSYLAWVLLGPSHGMLTSIKTSGSKQDTLSSFPVILLSVGSMLDRWGPEPFAPFCD